jgi:hypothetical protein
MSFGLLLSLSSLVSAADEAKGDTSSLTLSPTSQRYTIDAGKQQTSKLTILNTGDTTATFFVYGRPYAVIGEDYQPSFNSTASNSDAYKWVSFDKTEWQLEAGKSVEIPYTFRVPVGAAPGGHYGVIFVETKAPSGSGQAVVRNKRLGSILLATVNGSYRTSGNYLDTSIASYQPRTPLETTTRVQNTGNVDFETTQTIRVTDVFGSPKYSEVKKFTIFPDTVRATKMSWPKSPWFGLYKVKTTTAFLDQNHTKESLVLVAPRWMLLVLFVVVVGGAVYAFRRRR